VNGAALAAPRPAVHFSGMTSVITAPRVPGGRPPVWPLTVEAYHALGGAGLIPEDTELLHGIVYRKMPKSPLHTRLLLRLLRLFLAGVPAGFGVRPEQPLTLGDSEPEPDLAVVIGDENAHAWTHPTTAELVVEICVSSHEYDRDKLRAYAAAAVKEAWLVLGPEQVVEVHRRPTSGAYAETLRVGPPETLVSAAVPALRVPLAELFRA
jgi:Uma2 family endonuclease